MSDTTEAAPAAEPLDLEAIEKRAHPDFDWEDNNPEYYYEQDVTALIVEVRALRKKVAEMEQKRGLMDAASRVWGERGVL